MPIHDIITVDITELNLLLLYMKQIRDALDNQKSAVPTLSDQLDAAVTGTIPTIKSFEDKFAGWSIQLNQVTDEIDQAYTALQKVLFDAKKVAGDL